MLLACSLSRDFRLAPEAKGREMQRGRCAVEGSPPASASLAAPMPVEGTYRYLGE